MCIKKLFSKIEYKINIGRNPPPIRTGSKFRPVDCVFVKFHDMSNIAERPYSTNQIMFVHVLAQMKQKILGRKRECFNAR